MISGNCSNKKVHLSTRAHIFWMHTLIKMYNFAYSLSAFRLVSFFGSAGPLILRLCGRKREKEEARKRLQNQESKKERK